MLVLEIHESDGETNRPVMNQLLDTCNTSWRAFSPMLARSCNSAACDVKTMQLNGFFHCCHILFLPAGKTSLFAGCMKNRSIPPSPTIVDHHCKRVPLE
jgi:hypothetical protein